MNQIKANLSDGTIYDVRRVLKEMRLRKYYRNTSYIRSILLDLPLPIVAPADMVKVEALFLREDSVSHYPSFIYEAFHFIDSNHPILDWIIRR
jgi:pyruvate kinase